MEEYACVLDILPEGRPDDRRQFRREAIIYGLGVDEFKIFEMGNKTPLISLVFDAPAPVGFPCGPPGSACAVCRKKLLQ